MKVQEARALRAGEQAEVARVLARAFRDNPSSRAFLPGQDAEQRVRSLWRVFRGLAEATLRHGSVHVVDDGDSIAGASLSFAPGRFPMPVRAFAFLAYGPIAAGPRAALRYALADAWMHRMHLEEPHYYLFVLGVDPAMQGRGVGGALLRRISSAADRASVPCYLETDTEDNVRLYRHYGYEVTRDDRSRLLDNLRFWTMQRPAAASERAALRAT